MSFSDQLKKERKRLGITQAQVASMIEVPARTYWEWEAAKTTPYEITQQGALARLRATKKRK
jgi:transcriptional regulator with XRE-family HTH domain